MLRARIRGGDSDFLATWRRGRFIGQLIAPFRRIDRLRAGPRGEHVTARAESVGVDPGMLIVSRDGQLVRFAEGARAIAWGPLERWVAIAYADEIVVAERPDLRTERLIRVPLGARDVHWRF